MPFVAAADLGNNGGSTTNLTVSYTVSAGSGRLLVIGFSGDGVGGADDIVSVTYGGQACTSIASGVGFGSINGERFSYLYRLANPPTGANNVVITFSSVHYILAGVAEYSSFGALDNSANSVDTVVEDTYTSSITVDAANSWVISFAQCSGSSVSGGTNATLRTFEGAFTSWGLFDSNAGLAAGSRSTTTTIVQTASFGQIKILASFAPSIVPDLLPGQIWM
jgi:hypothetical protein